MGHQEGEVMPGCLAELALMAEPKSRHHVQLQHWQDNATVSQTMFLGAEQPWVGASPL